MALGSGVGDATYLAAVRDVIAQASARGEPALVIYVAGVDVAIDDTLGSWRVSHDAIFERDRLVIERFRNVPLVMVPAGGYGRDAWRHTARTLVWLLSGEDRPFSTQLDAELKALRKIARSLGENELSGRRDRADDFGITEADLMGDLVRNRPRSQLLGFYTAFGVELAFEKYGLIEHIRKRGYPRVRVELNLQAGSGEAITVYTDDAHRLHVVELVVREMRDVAPYRLLSIEWLLLQDPNAKPSPDRPLLPGQDHPGLGALKIVIGMLAMAAERLRFDGLSFVPAHYHTAAQARGVLRFLNAADEARFTCIKEAVGAKSIGEISLLLNADGLVDDGSGEVIKWKPAQMVMPISEALRGEFGPDYDRRVEQAARSMRFVLK
ncbi:MAG: hypothetical protein IPK82_04925 [Polyangiaceae bacterium]|nr:hypothetical protein [Polyangiaceae bacterium]